MNTKEYQKRWRQENAEKCKQYDQKYYRTHVEERRARSRRYYAANREACLSRSKRWQAAHLAYYKTVKFRAQRALLREANRERLTAYNREYQRRRRAKIKREAGEL